MIKTSMKPDWAREIFNAGSLAILTDRNMWRLVVTDCFVKMFKNKLKHLQSNLCKNYFFLSPMWRENHCNIFNPILQNFSFSNQFSKFR